jgi:hypothetical protein
MNIEHLLSSPNYDEKELCRAFYDLCSEKLKAVTIKNLFLNVDYKEKFNTDVLTHGLLAALIHENTNYIKLINSQIAKTSMDIETDLPNLQFVFNCIAHSNNLELAKSIDQKYSIIEQSLNENVGKNISLLSGRSTINFSLHNDGSLDISAMPGWPKTEMEENKISCKINPVFLNIRSFNSQVLDLIFDNNYEINPSLITHAIVKSVYLENNELIKYFFQNEKCAKIINNSEIIKAFIKSDANWSDNKKEIRIALSMAELNQELNNNNKIGKGRPKI